MRDTLERHGPRTPAARLVAFFVAGLLGVPGLVLTLGALVNTGVLPAILVSIPSVLLTYVSYVFGSSVARRAADAPEPDRWDGSSRSDVTAEESDPVKRLQRRYADGELSTEEFERRLDALVESDANCPTRAVRGGRTGRSRPFRRTGVRQGLIRPVDSRLDLTRPVDFRMYLIRSVDFHLDLIRPSRHARTCSARSIHASP